MKKGKVFLILFPLFLGIGIYLLYRSKNLFYFKFFSTHPVIYEHIISLRELAWSYRKHLPLWSVYSLPDGLWLFSFGAALLVDRKFYTIHFIIFTLIYIFMVGLEFVQKYFGGHGTMLGTFDYLDIVFFTCGYMCISLISILLYKLQKNSFFNEIHLTKKDELIEDLKFSIIFLFLGVLPSLF